MTEHTHEFQAEVAKLLDIVTHSLYSEKEIFLRELVSNASDACDRLRYEALTNPDLIKDDPDFKITISVDEKARTLIIEDNGIGMSEQDMIDNLGTIARSGTSRFSEQMTGDAAKDVTLIGQFGVGFYSAFMVADKVTVTSRRAGEENATLWASEGHGTFVTEAANRDKRGTSIVLHMRKDAKEYLEPARLRQIIKTYADHIAIPVVLKATKEGEEDQTLNTASALWTRPKSEITEEQYTEFYHHVGQAFDSPWLTLHSRAEGRIEYTMLLYIPEQPPFDLFNPERKSRLKLYVKRVFITDDCEELIPAYLRFLRGIVDSEDLPLNVSREMLQHNPVLQKIRNGLIKKVLGELEKKAEKEKESFAKFWSNFGAVLKEGIYEDAVNGERILKMALFNSTVSDTQTDLAGYVSRMKEGQDAIFYISGDDLGALKSSPQLEGFAAKGVEVLLLGDAVDSFWLSRISEFDGKPFKSVTRGAADLEKITGAEEAKDETPKADEGEMDRLIALFKTALDGKVKDVRASSRLTGSPVCLVADDGDMDIHLEKLLKAHKQFGGGASLRILELNPKHMLIKKLAASASKNGASDALEDAALLLLDQAHIVEGDPVADPVAFSKRMADFMAESIAV